MLAIREISAVITAVAFIEYIYCIQRHSSNNTPQPPHLPGVVCVTVSRTIREQSCTSRDVKMKICNHCLSFHVSR